ncbi:hypothetical protein GVAV_000130 [Gurleya vavrai]
MPFMGEIKTDPVRIKLKDNIPTISKAFPISISLKSNVRSELEKLEKMEIIKKSESSYAAPAFFTLKKDGSIRTLVDFRAPIKNLKHPECFQQFSKIWNF